MAFLERSLSYDEDNSLGESEEEEDEISGYKYEFVDPVASDQECPVCLLPMRDAVQTAKCGHRFCRSCLKKSSRAQGSLYCPRDRQPVRKYFPDTAWNRDILGLRVKCVLNDRGCDWIGQVRHAKNHESECPYEEEDCDGCGEAIQRRHMERHTDDECPQRIVACDHCDQRFAFSEKQKHEETFCRQFPLPCLNNCGETGIPREMMGIHLSKTCPMEEVGCPYAEAGCTFKDKRANLSDHIEEKVQHHLDLTWSSLQNFRNKNKKYMKFVLEDRESLNEKMDLVHKENADFKASILKDYKRLAKQVALVQVENTRLRETIDDMMATREHERTTIKEARKAVSAFKVREYQRPAPY